MGTPDFAVPTLEHIVKAGHEVAAVVTQPDKAKGRGKSIQYTPVKEKALEYGIHVYQPVKVREASFVQLLKELKPDVMVVVAFGQILPKAILDIPVYGCINVHASLLPKYRGAAPIQWAVIRGEKVSGVTTMQMGEGLDDGDMILKATVTLDAKETGGSLHDKLSLIGAELLIETLGRLEDGSAVRIPQDVSQKGEYARMLSKDMGKIDFNQDASSIECLIRGLNPWPSAFTFLDGKTLKFWSADVLDKNYEGQPGEVVEIQKDGFVVKAKEGALKIKELQLEGKKRMSSDAFLRGYLLEVHTMLGTNKE